MYNDPGEMPMTTMSRAGVAPPPLRSGSNGGLGQETPFGRELNKIERQIKRFGELVDKLHQKLDPVLGMTPPLEPIMRGDTIKPETPAMSSLTGLLFSHANEIRRSNDHLEDVLSRIEL